MIFLNPPTIKLFYRALKEGLNLDSFRKIKKLAEKMDIKLSPYDYDKLVDRYYSMAHNHVEGKNVALHSIEIKLKPNQKIIDYLAHVDSNGILNILITTASEGEEEFIVATTKEWLVNSEKID